MNQLQKQITPFPDPQDRIIEILRRTEEEISAVRNVRTRLILVNCYGEEPIKKDEAVDVTIAHACNAFGVPIGEFVENVHNRKPRYVQIRNCVSYVLRNTFRFTLREITRELGDKHHSTIISNLRRHEADVDTDLIYRNKVSRVNLLVAETLDEMP